MKRLVFILILLILPAAAFSQDDEEESRIFQCNPGPWGELEYYFTYLEAPEHSMELVGSPSEKTTWLFPGKSLNQLREFLETAGAPPVDVAELLAETNRFHVRPPYRLLPSAAFIENLTPVTRGIIYTELRKWSENRFYHAPAIIESNDVAAWFSSSDITPETVAKIEQLTYPIGRSLAFSDVSVVLSGITTDREERAFLKALTRTRSMILRLKVTPETDFDGLSSYWTVGFRHREALPFIESIARSPRERHIDIANLLPPTARKYLNTFPSLTLGLDGIYPDSFWASLNFFRYRPLSDFNDRLYVLQETDQFYSKAIGENTFGDLIILRNPITGEAQHACIYIADDIVYTKNGRSILRPFMLMKFSDLLARSAAEFPPRIEVLRRN